MTTAETRDRLWSLLGDLPDRGRPVSAVTVSAENRPGYHIKKLSLDLNGIEPVPAYFVRPLGATGRLPTVVYHHSHGGEHSIGKEELLGGREYLHLPPYAEFLTGLGFNAVCIDHWCFGERSGRSESEVFKEMLWNGRILWGMMVFDSIRLVDYLASRADVDASRLATVGMSMGSTMAWWLAALDERIRACVELCCLTDFRSLLNRRSLDRHGLYYYVPGLLKHFETADILGLIAPRPFLSLAGRDDPLTPVEGLEKIDSRMKQVYASLGAADHWSYKVYEHGHLECADMRHEVEGFLRRHLA